MHFAATWNIQAEYMIKLSDSCPKPNRSPAQRVRFGKEEQRRERALTFAKKVGASFISLASISFWKSEQAHGAAPPFPQKVTLRLCCSLVNALTTRRLATNFLRDAPAPRHLFYIVITRRNGSRSFRFFNLKNQPPAPPFLLFGRRIF